MRHPKARRRPCGQERRIPDAGYDKARLYQPGLVIPPLAPTSLRRDNLAELALERLVDFPREVRIELTKLGSFRDKALVRALDVVALHLNRLFERLRADELLGGGSAVLEHLLRVVRNFHRDRLHAL